MPRNRDRRNILLIRYQDTVGHSVKIGEMQSRLELQVFLNRSKAQPSKSAPGLATPGHESHIHRTHLEFNINANFTE